MLSSKQLVIFLVEDDAFTSALIKSLIEEKTKWVIKTFRSGEEMLEVYKKDTKYPDYVLLDYRLDSKNPKALNGEKVLYKIREYSQSLPVIMVTASNDIDRALRLLESGLTEYIEKNEKLAVNIINTIEDKQMFADNSAAIKELSGERADYTIAIFVLMLAAGAGLFLYFLSL